VRVTLGTEADAAVLRVRDTGHGIPEADLPRVTEPFFSTKLTGEGLGLGLSICKAILADMNGRLDIVSDEGRGTEVTVRLPRAAQVREAAE
jgi:two-component system C4-dicarboxylate transport sensor histidine kinase DctB